MALGSLNECWCCYERKRYDNSNLKQICTPIRGKKGTLLEHCIVWLCSECRKEIKNK